jgi:hypothetical protein
VFVPWRPCSVPVIVIEKRWINTPIEGDSLRKPRGFERPATLNYPRPANRLAMHQKQGDPTTLGRSARASSARGLTAKRKEDS